VAIYGQRPILARAYAHADTWAYGLIGERRPEQAALSMGNYGVQAERGAERVRSGICGLW